MLVYQLPQLPHQVLPSDNHFTIGKVPAYLASSQIPLEEPTSTTSQPHQPHSTTFAPESLQRDQFATQQELVVFNVQTTHNAVGWTRSTVQRTEQQAVLEVPIVLQTEAAEPADQTAIASVMVVSRLTNLTVTLQLVSAKMLFYVTVTLVLVHLLLAETLFSLTVTTTEPVSSVTQTPTVDQQIWDYNKSVIQVSALDVTSTLTVQEQLEPTVSQVVFAKTVTPDP
jgi:hypothetical protein